MIFVEEPLTWKQIAVPPSIVRECAEFTHQDPYSDDELSKLILLDCYWMKMGYYDGKGLLNIHRLEVNPYDQQGTLRRHDGEVYRM